MINDIVKQALSEDIGSGDVSAALLAEDEIISAQVLTRQRALIFGKRYFEASFFALDKNVTINWLVKEGQWLEANTVLCQIQGKQRALLTAERVALNFLQILSGTATQTKILLEKISHTHCQLLDTRKTIPNLRHGQKQAVLAGGGVNHRFGLYDAVMIKENHIKRLGGISQAVEKARQQQPRLPLIVEVENLKQLAEAAQLPVDRILCDNFSPALLSRAVKAYQHNCPLEASGGINASNIAVFAQTGVAFISTSAMTKNVASIDLSMQVLSIV